MSFYLQSISAAIYNYWNQDKEIELDLSEDDIPFSANQPEGAAAAAAAPVQNDPPQIDRSLTDNPEAAAIQRQVYASLTAQEANNKKDDEDPIVKEIFKGTAHQAQQTLDSLLQSQQAAAQPNDGANYLQSATLLDEEGQYAEAYNHLLKAAKQNNYEAKFALFVLFHGVKNRKKISEDGKNNTIKMSNEEIASNAIFWGKALLDHLRKQIEVAEKELEAQNNPQNKKNLNALITKFNELEFYLAVEFYNQEKFAEALPIFVTSAQKGSYQAVVILFKIFANPLGKITPPSDEQAKNGLIRMHAEEVHGQAAEWGQFGRKMLEERIEKLKKNYDELRHISSESKKEVDRIDSQLESLGKAHQEAPSNESSSAIMELMGNHEEAMQSYNEACSKERNGRVELEIEQQKLADLEKLIKRFELEMKERVVVNLAKLTHQANNENEDAQVRETARQTLANHFRNDATHCLERRPIAALKRFEQAATYGDIYSMLMLSKLYCGVGIGKDKASPEKSKHWANQVLVLANARLQKDPNDAKVKNYVAEANVLLS